MKLKMLENTKIHNEGWSKSVVKYGKWYLLSSFITKGLGILLLPIYTRYLSPDEYGILQGLNSVANFLPFILSLSLDAAFGRFFHEDKVDFRRLQVLYSTVYWFVFVYGILLLLGIFATSKFWLTDLLEVPVFPYAYLSFIPALLNQLALLGRTFLQQSLETKKSTMLDVASTILNAGISVLLLVAFNMGVVSRLLGIFAGALFLFLYYHIYFRKIELLIYAFSWSTLLRCLKYAIPMLPAMAGSWISSMSDRLVIAKYCSLASVGLYSLAFQLGQLLYILGDAITRVISPIVMSGLVYDKENTKEKISSTAYFIFLIMLFGEIMLYLFADEFITVFADKRYFESALFIPVFGFNYVLGMQQRFPTSIISYKNKTWIISAGCIFSACVNLGLNILFVPQLGYEFAVWASVASNLTYCIWTFIWGQKLEKVDYKFGRYAVAFMVFLGLIGMAIILKRPFDKVSFVSVGVKVIWAGFAFVIFLLMFNSWSLKGVIPRIKSLIKR